ncbi:MAG: class I SAM-dependent methyltransferase [Nitrospirota bacterium]|nr:class I SAM-dependent methyltransferase [Nitrospirota bacterium]
MIENHPAFSPGLARMNEGFDADYFGELSKLEAGNFWFRSRNDLILYTLKRYFPQAENFFEIGCGTGFVLAAIEKAFPHLLLFGSDIYSLGVSFASKRMQNALLFQMDARSIPFEQEFDVIGAFDVLEHIHEDQLALKQIWRALKHGGGIIITVPQHLFLWSKTDEASCHVRRYSAKELKEKVVRAGFEIVKMTSFVTLLLPFMMASRHKKQKSDQDFDVFTELRLNGTLNSIFEHILDFERLLIRLGVNLPAGGSLLLVARKPMKQQ